MPSTKLPEVAKWLLIFISGCVFSFFFDGILGLLLAYVMLQPLVWTVTMLLVVTLVIAAIAVLAYELGRQSILDSSPNNGENPHVP